MKQFFFFYSFDVVVKRTYRILVRPDDREKKNAKDQKKWLGIKREQAVQRHTFTDIYSLSHKRIE